MKKILKIILWSLAVIIVLANVLILLSGKTYIYKTLVYQKPDLDDYKIFPNREVKAGKYQPWKISSKYNKGRVSESFAKEMKDLETTAFLVIKNDSILYEKYSDEGSPTTISNSFSMAKSIIGVLTGIAIKEGKLKMDEPIGDFLPEFRTGDKATITVRNLLTMSSGLEWDEEYSDLFSITTEAYYGTDLQKLVLHKDLATRPGKVCYYKTIDVQLLAMILHKATGKTISDYASEKLWKKIGSEKEALWSLDHKGGDEKAYCCFNAVARDFARIGKLYLQHGDWNGENIVPADYVAESTKPNGLKDEDGDSVDYYGYLWWTMKYEGKPVFYARGIKGQYIIVLPEQNMIIVRLGNKRSPEFVENRPKEIDDMIAEGVRLGR